MNLGAKLIGLRERVRSGRSLDALWTGIGTMLSAVAVLASLAILTLVLSAEQFGVYAGVVSAGGVLLGFAVFGSSEAMLLALARRDRDEAELSTLGRIWGRGLGTTVLAASVCYAVLMAATSVILPDVSPGLIAALVAGEYISSGAGTVNVQLLRGIGRFKEGALLSIFAYGARPVAAASLFFVDDPALEDYARVNLVMAVAVAVLSTIWIARTAGRPNLSIPTTAADYRQGAAIALGQTSNSVSAGIDQTLLLRAGFERDNGLYGIGVRIVSYSLLPAAAVTTTIYPEFFSKGAEGIEATVAFAKRMAKPMVAYGLFILPPLWIGALVVEWLLGDDYDGVAVVIWSMSGFPVLRIMQSLLGDSLKGVGRFGAASVAIMITAALNVTLNLWLIPDYSWKGAAVATYASEIVYLGLLFAALRRARAAVAPVVAGSSDSSRSGHRG